MSGKSVLRSLPDIGNMPKRLRLVGGGGQNRTSPSVSKFTAKRTSAISRLKLISKWLERISESVGDELLSREMVEMELTFRAPSDGGRRVIPDGILTGGRYRPHLVVGPVDQQQAIIEDGNRLVEDYRAVVFLNGPDHVEPLQTVNVEAALAYFPSVDYSLVVPGASFTIREGPQIVAHGHIIKRWSNSARD